MTLASVLEDVKFRRDQSRRRWHELDRRLQNLRTGAHRSLEALSGFCNSNLRPPTDAASPVNSVSKGGKPQGAAPGPNRSQLADRLATMSDRRGSNPQRLTMGERNRPSALVASPLTRPHRGHLAPVGMSLGVPPAEPHSDPVRVRPAAGTLANASGRPRSLIAETLSEATTLLAFLLFLGGALLI